MVAERGTGPSRGSASCSVRCHGANSAVDLGPFTWLPLPGPQKNAAIAAKPPQYGGITIRCG
jgi:hypothetical protein